MATALQTTPSGRGDMRGKTVVVTGASSGIGLETTRALAAMGARVMMVVRSRERGDAAIANIKTSSIGGVPDAQLELVLADLYELAQVRAAAAELRARCPRIDVLVNNAGLVHKHQQLTVDGLDQSFALNHLAGFLLSYELRDVLAASAPARVVTVSSFAHYFARFDWDDLPYNAHWKGETAVYGTGKLCNIWFAREAARRLAAHGVTSNALHPGGVASNFGANGSWMYRAMMKVGRPFLLSPAQGARTSVYLASSPAAAAETGEYFVRCHVARISKRARDDASARRLWALSERLCGVTWA